MVSFRLIPVLLLSEGDLVKSTNFKNYNYIGDPINAIKISRVILELIGNKVLLNNILNSFSKINSSENEIIDQYINSDKAKNELGINFENDFSDSINKTIDWYRKYL